MTCRGRLRGASLAAAAAFVLAGVPTTSVSAADVTINTVAELRARLEAATRAAEAAAAPLYAAAAQRSDLRIQLSILAERREAVRGEIGRRIRHIYMYGQPDPVTQLLSGLANPDFTALRLGAQKELRSDAEMMDDLAAQNEEMRALRQQVDAMRAELLRAAQPVLAAQEAARQLLLEAETRFAAQLAELQTWRNRLDVLSSNVAFAVTPSVTTRGRLAAAAEEPIVRLLEAAGSGMPPGYRLSGYTISGIASWYGPGFVGNPTATGTPYDPERFTAAMLAVPLGTVVRVTSVDGLAVNVLINDRGPFGKGRVIDMSRAGARMLNFTGLKQVTVEVLEKI